MKKIILAVLCFFTVPLLAAQQLSPNYSAFFKGDLTRAILHQEKQSDWKRQLTRIQIQFKQLSHNTPTRVSFPVKVLSPLSLHEEQNYLYRLSHVQKLLHANELLRGYRFEAPVAIDLASLSQENYEALLFFLHNHNTTHMIQAQRVRPFTLALRIKGMVDGQVEVWIDEPTKKIYLMSNNIYTTATGKYGLWSK